MDAEKAVLTQKFIAIEVFLKKTGKISNKQSNHTQKELEKEEKQNPKLAEGKKS